jgi:hypothetical protein
MTLANPACLHDLPIHLHTGLLGPPRHTPWVQYGFGSQPPHFPFCPTNGSDHDPGPLIHERGRNTLLGSLCLRGEQTHSWAPSAREGADTTLGRSHLILHIDVTSFQPPRLIRWCTCTSRPFAGSNVYVKSVLTQTCRCESQSKLSMGANPNLRWEQNSPGNLASATLLLRRVLRWRSTRPGPRTPDYGA